MQLNNKYKLHIERRQDMSYSLAELAELEARLAEAEAENDFEAVACICNDIADLKGEPHPYSQEWFDDL